MKLDFGKVFYGDSLRNDNKEFLDACVLKFSLNYWGFADKEQWKSNNAALKDSKGEIRAQYKNENGMVVHIIRINTELPHIRHGVYSIICTPKDLENGFYEKVQELMTKNPSKNKRMLMWA